jgi:hypothetical protein
MHLALLLAGVCPPPTPRLHRPARPRPPASRPTPPTPACSGDALLVVFKAARKIGLYQKGALATIDGAPACLSVALAPERPHRAQAAAGRPGHAGGLVPHVGQALVAVRTRDRHPLPERAGRCGRPRRRPHQRQPGRRHPRRARRGPQAAAGHAARRRAAHPRRRLQRRLDARLRGAGDARAGPAAGAAAEDHGDRCAAAAVSPRSRSNRRYGADGRPPLPVRPRLHHPRSRH